MYRGAMWEHGNKRACSGESIREPLLQVEVFLFLRGERLCGVRWELTDTGWLSAPSMVSIGHCFHVSAHTHTHTLVHTCEMGMQMALSSDSFHGDNDSSYLCLPTMVAMGAMRS